MAVLEDLIVYGVAAGLGTAGTTIFKGSGAIYPVGDGPYVTLIETGGSGPEGTHNSLITPAYVRPSVQFVARGKVYDTVRAKLVQWYNLVFDIRNQTINGTYWRQVVIVQEPFDLPPDSAGRVRLAFNANVVKRP